MSEDLDRLRQTMAQLAEHGGNTDLYERSLHTSRRLGRRRAVASGVAAAAAVLTIGVPVALINRQRPATVVPADTATASPHTSLSASPSANTIPPSADPTVQPTDSTVGPSRTTKPQNSTSRTDKVPASGQPSNDVSPPAGAAPGDGCPVSAATLERVADLETGYRLRDSSIECKQGWAIAGVTAPTPEQQGDGIILFKYEAAAGTWTKKGEGSSFDCATEGIPKSTGFCSDEGG